MWSSRLFRRVFVPFAVLIVAAAGVFAFVVSQGEEAELRGRLLEQLRVTARLLGELVVPIDANDPSSSTANDSQHLQDRVRRLGTETGMRMTVVAIDGHVLADSGRTSAIAVSQMEDHRHRPEIQQALRGGSGWARRYSPTDDEEQLYYAWRVDHDGRPIAIARASVSELSVTGQIRRVSWRIWTFAASVAAFGLAVSGYLLARFTRPVTNLTHAVERMASGYLGEHVEIPAGNEFGMLARAFNRLSDELLAQLEQLRERGDQLAAVLGGMVEGVIAVDRRAKVMFANGAAGRLFDFRAEQARGRPLLTLVRDETLHQAFRRAIDSGGVVNAEIERFSPASGALAVHATPLPGSPCPGVVLVLYDLTQLRRLESIREEFVANVSHELKTPLSSIKAYAETLRAGAINDQEHNLEFVKRIEDQAERLHQLILDLISLARIESGEEAYEIGDVDLQDTIDGCLSEYQPSAAAKQIELLADPPAEPLVVRADDEALRQILDNLLSNALKYVPEGGRVTVRWRRQHSDALIEVIDTGIGIDALHIDRIFERFYRVDKARSRELGGTGLGLSIVKHLAQFFGGSVGVRSRVGKGSTFWVRLPLAEGTTESAA